MPPEKYALARCKAREPGVPVIVHPESQRISAGVYRPRDINRESGISAFMPPNVPATLIEDIGDLNSTPSNSKEQPFGQPIRWNVDQFSIPADTDVKIGSAKIGEIKRVRQADLSPVAVIEISLLRADIVAEQKFPLTINAHPNARGFP